MPHTCAAHRQRSELHSSQVDAAAGRAALELPASGLCATSQTQSWGGAWPNTRVNLQQTRRYLQQAIYSSCQQQGTSLPRAISGAIFLPVSLKVFVGL